MASHSFGQSEATIPYVPFSSRWLQRLGVETQKIIWEYAQGFRKIVVQ